ncbi:hypothetical protein BGZ80_001042 [Entomortierella chlamydospora]|uniref:Nucleoprotein TPR/MLP1 domain-containing protein n=1 Tax=Entomortierella chlamydospora TaxID=101097 RepID=A0A9P6N1V8_9FUNG|nr:hypothetical protein BGZ80_001042 [Entomortierella chlamydospora]
MEDAQTTLNDQKRIRISKFLSLENEDLSRLLDQLKDEAQVASAINKLIQRLDETAIQHASDVSWKQQAEEAKASLSTETINFEQRLQQYETRVNTTKSLLTDTRQKLKAATKEAQDAAQLEQQLSSQQSGTLHTNVEMQALKSRVETLEGEKRETLGALERKVSELQQANEDYQSMSSRYQELKKESSKLESESREAKASEMSLKLQKQATEQELEMLKQRMEWTNSELEAKSTELSTYRAEKTAQILQLQADLDQVRIEATAATQSNSTLQRRVKEQQDKLEEAIEKNKELQDKTLVQEEQFRVEMETQRRLGELWERAATDTKGRIADLELTLEDMQRSLSNKDSEYQETINELSEERLQLQLKLEQSSVEITQLKEEQKRADELLNKAGLIDTSGASGFDIGRLGVLSPTAAAAARLQKTGMSLTQVYTRYMELQSEHTHLKTDHARLQESMDAIVQELADGAPLIREQQLEYQRLEQHAKELSAQLEAASQEKEQIAFGAREALAQLDGVVKERDLLHKENQDLDRQVQNLLWRLKAPNAPQSLAPASTLSADTGSTTEGEKAIDEHLVLFSNIQELQQQNKQLREIARKFTKEQEEAKGEQAQARKKEEQDVIEEAERVIESMREDIGAKELQIATYKQELDMMRRILKTSNMRNVPAVNAPTDGTIASVAAAQPGGDADKPTSNDSSEYAKLLTDLQKTFDAYRNETSIDNRLLKDQLQQCQADNSDYRIQLGRSKTQIEVLNERYQLLLENSTHQSNEMSELRKRCTYLQDASTRHEIANQKLSSDLYAERDSVSRVTVELNNLKTEKALWKSFESRLMEENQALTKEKSHLNELLQTVQSMTNELERSHEQTKRRLENAVNSKEQEVETLKEKLKEEVESGTRMRDRREIESKEWQSRIDSLQAEYQSSREALIAAKTSLEHTNAKVEDLTKQIKSREDQLAIYQQKPAGSESTETTREEQLQAQMVQLHADLARHQAEAEASRTHLAQFQAISQTNEDRLAEMTATFEEFKKEHDLKLEENAQTIKSLETKLSSAEERAQSAASNLVEMQNKADEERGVWRKEKEELESKSRKLEDIQSQMNSVEERYRRDIRIQAAQTKEAHENYERELVNHAKDIEALTRLKEKHSRQTAELERYRTASESAISNLQAAELSWEGQKSVLQKTLSEVEKRCAELKDQNDKLHRHLEDVSAQALTIQQRMNAPIASGEDGNDAPSEGTKGNAEHQLAELRDVVRYVRREKEILMCQHELNLQESRRLKQQLEQTNRSLEETRSSLTEERSKHQEAMVSKQQHEQLLEKINQLNLLRESNTTLRAENERLQKRVLRLEDLARELQGKLNPLNEQVSEMKADLELSKEELKQVGEDRDRWRTRTVEIMAKHDRIDPTEFQELKDTVEKNKTERDELENVMTALKTEGETLKTENESLQARLKDASGKLAKLSGHAQAWRKKHTEEAAKVEELQKELATLKARITELEKLLEEANNKPGSEDPAIQAKHEAEKAELKEKKEFAEKNFEATRTRLNLSVNRNKQLSAKIKEQEAALAELRAGRDAAAPASGSITQAEMEAKIEEEKQKVIADLTAKHETAIKMNEMRQQLKIQTKEKEILNLKNQLASASSESNTTSVATTLSPMAQTFRPQAAATIPVRPTNSVRIVRPNTAAAQNETSPAARQLAGLPPRPTQGKPTPRPPGQSRLRPPLGDRVAAAAAASNSGAQPGVQSMVPTADIKPPVVATPAVATSASPVEPVSTVVATPALAPIPAATAALVPNPASTATVPTPTQATPSAPTQTSRLLIKRRREDELPGNLKQPPGSSPSLTATTVEAGLASGSPSVGPTPVVSTQEQKSSPMIIKRQRQLPVVEPAVVPVPEVAESTSTSETKTQTVHIQRNRLISATDSSAIQSTSRPTSTTTVVTEPDSASSTENGSKTSPHGQKRRHETTEGIQENIAIVSTPGPGDLEETEESSTVEHPSEHMSMDVDDVPPVKRARPSQVAVTELPEEATPSAEAAEDVAAPETPGHLTDFDEGEVEEETTDTTGAAAVTGVSAPVGTGEAKAAEEDQHQREPAQETGADHALVEELDEGLEVSYGTPGTTDVAGFEDVEEEGELDLDMDEQREHEGGAEASESSA